MIRSLALLGGLLLAVSASTAASTDRGQYLHHVEDDTARVTVLYVASTGWAYHDDDGQLTGVTVELMRRFADFVDARLGITLELDFEEESDWSRFYQRVRDGQGGLFGLGNVTITDARREELAFSPAYVTNVAVLISGRDVSLLDEPTRIQDGFAGLRAMAFESTLHETRLRELAEAHWPDMPVDLAGSNDEIIDAAAAGSHFGYIDAYNYYRARDQRQPVRRHPAFDDPGEEFGVIMPLDNDWQLALEDFFAADGGLLGTDWYRELIETHLGSEVAGILTDPAD